MEWDGLLAFTMTRSWRSQGAAWHSALRHCIHTAVEEGGGALRETRRPGEGPTLAHTQVVEVALLQEPRMSAAKHFGARQKRQREFPFADCAINGPLRPGLRSRSAGSASGVEVLTVQGLSAASRRSVKHNLHPWVGRLCHGATPHQLYFFASLGFEIVDRCSCALSKAHRDLCTISTFGFGYNMDSLLLVEMALTGFGTYSFIPDASFVGTVFVNIVSNLLVAMAQEVFFDLQCEDGLEISKVRGDYAHTKTWSGFRISLGTLQICQLRDIALQVLVAKPEGNFLGRSKRRHTHTSGLMKYRLDPPKPSLCFDEIQV